MSVIVKNLTHIYDEGMPFASKALDDISFEIKDNDFVGLIGHTGSGKSTLIQHLNGLLKPSSGQIIVNGFNITDKDLNLNLEWTGNIFNQFKEKEGGQVYKLGQSLQATENGVQVNFSKIRETWSYFSTEETKFVVNYEGETKTIAEGNSYKTNLIAPVVIKSNESFTINSTQTYTFTTEELNKEQSKIQDMFKNSEKYFEENNITIQFEEGDEEIIASYPVDFITFSYYRSRVVSAEETEAAEKIIDTNTLEGIENPYLPKTDWGWTIDPDGLMLALQELAGRYEKPLFISENGLGAIDTVGENHTINDIYRIQYMKGHIEAMKRAIENGVNLFGYTMWGPIDIVSNGTGQMSKRYGIIYVDLDDNGHGTGKRYKKRSYDWYKKVIASNGEELSIEK